MSKQLAAETEKMRQRMEAKKTSGADKTDHEYILRIVEYDQRTAVRMLDGYIPPRLPILVYEVAEGLPRPYECGECANICHYVDLDPPEVRKESATRRAQRAFCSCEESRISSRINRENAEREKKKELAASARLESLRNALGLAGRAARYRLSDTDPYDDSASDAIVFDPTRSVEQTMAYRAAIRFCNAIANSGSGDARSTAMRRQEPILRGRSPISELVSAVDKSGGAVARILERVSNPEIQDWKPVFESIRGLVFGGPNGVGKTMLCAAISHRLVNYGVSVIRYRSADLLDAMRAEFDPSNKSVSGQTMERCTKSNVLWIDDLGKEYIPAGPSRRWSLQQLFRIIDYRYDAELPMLITTNLRAETLERYLGNDTDGEEGDHGKAIISRLMECCEWYWIDTADNRLPLDNSK